MQKFAVKAILIDLDGTLIDTAPEIARAANVMLAAVNLPLQSASQIKSYIGEGALVLIERCLKQALYGAPNDGVVDSELLAEAKAVFFSAYANIVTESQAYTSVKESLAKLHQLGFKLACITNKPASFTEPLLKNADLYQYFSVVVSGDTLPQKKPDPAPLHFACKALGVTIQNAVMVGDSKTDILAARNAGCAAFAVAGGYNQGLAITAGEVDVLLSNFAALLEHIELKT